MMLRKIIFILFVLLVTVGCSKEEANWEVSNNAAYLVVRSDESSLDSSSRVEFHYFDNQGNLTESHKSIYFGAWHSEVSEDVLYLGGVKDLIVAYNLNNHQLTEIPIQGEADDLLGYGETLFYHTANTGTGSSLCAYNLSDKTNQCIVTNDQVSLHLADNDRLIVNNSTDKTFVNYDYQLNVIKDIDYHENEKASNTFDNPDLSNHRIIAETDSEIISLANHGNQSTLYIHDLDLSHSKEINTWNNRIEIHDELYKNQFSFLLKEDSWKLGFWNIETSQQVILDTDSTANIVCAVAFK